MGIDLEQPSREHHKEDRLLVNVSVGDPQGEVCNRDGATLSDNAKRDKETTRQSVSGCTSNSKHKVHASDGVPVNSHTNIEPYDGLEFESKEDAFSFYKEYAKSVGFATIIKASRRSRISGKFIDAKFVCTRYGSKRESGTSDTPEPVLNAVSATSIPNKRKRGSLSQESYNIAFNALEEALKKCESVNNSIQSVLDPGSPSAHALHDFEEGTHGNITRKTNKKNDLSRKGQVQSETEVITMGMHDSWQQMGHSNLQAPTLGCSYEMQESIQGMEQLNSRVPVPTLDGYFGTQQIMQGMGQLNAMAPSRDDYYSNQQNIQGLGQLNSIAPIHDAPYLVQPRLHGLGPLHFRPQTIQSCFDIQDSLQHMDQSDVGPTQLHGMASKHLHSKHLSSKLLDGLVLGV
ncbi:Protein FAR-RED ELONGATED HYPOCOTYL 3 [Camellia lanceoleosa]|uniref:Protein FAR-RED ELONGATED HYPOCOTYL 3 n=1 Tax=Camellia lanceoleosa TaxID=1840588 RepID=A0ACC0GGF1_9ERIC|nr:Protein FAR-RED ELONGATED HYPOCOTYL 3 [Camellia lanceoleosa]